MEENQKMDIAVFRYSVIHDFVGGVNLEYGEKQKLLREKCARKWAILILTKPVSAKARSCVGFSAMKTVAERWNHFTPKGVMTGENKGHWIPKWP